MKYTEKNTDNELAQEIVNGNQQAFRMLFDRYYLHLLGTAINLLRDQGKAKDIVQDVFFKIWENRKKIDPKNNIAGYLKRSVINKCLNNIRDNKKVITNELPLEKSSSEHSADDIIQGKELSEVIQKALNNLPERCRMVFILKRFEGHSLNEIAKQMDISPKTVENQMTKALKALKLAVLPYVTK